MLCSHGQFSQVLSQMPYFRRSGGRDHIFVFPRYFFFHELCVLLTFGKVLVIDAHIHALHFSGAGAHLFRSWAKFINRSIILTPEVFTYSYIFIVCFSFFDKFKSAIDRHIYNPSNPKRLF